MFQVKNKNVLKLLARRQMKNSRQRNGIAVAAIVLTAILFSALFTVGGGILAQAQQSLMRMTGSTGQASVKYLSMAEYEQVEKAGGYEKIGYSILTGTGADPRLQKMTTEVRYAQDYVAETFLAYPEEGTMPEKKTDIALSRLVLEAMELPDTLGSQIVFPIEVNGKVYKDTFTLCGVWEGDPLAPAQQAWVSRAYSDEAAPVLMTRFEEDTPYEGTVGAEIDFSNPWNLPRKMAQLLERAGLPEDTPIGISPIYLEVSMDPELILTILILLIAVLVSGYLIIYNIFYISVTSDIQFYGLLKTIGASGKQIRRIVFRQALILSAIGIPAGLLAGYAVGKLLLPFAVMQFHIDGFGDNTVSPMALIGAAAFSLLTVWISFLSPGRTAAAVSPVEAAHYTGEKQKKSKIKHKNAHRRNETWKGTQRKWFRKQMDPSILLGFRNLHRDGKKAVLVILSLFLSMTLLNTTYTILKGFDLDQYVSSHTNGDFEVTDWTIASMNLMPKGKNTEGIDREFEEAISRFPGLRRFDKVYYEENQVELSEDVLQWMEEMASQGIDISSWGLDTGTETVHAYAATGNLIGQIEYSAGTFDAEKWEEGSYVIYEDITDRDGGSKPLYQPGDQITLFGKEGQKKEYTVMANGSLPYTLTSRYYINLGMSVILPEQEFISLYGERQPLSVVYDVEPSYRAEAEKQTAKLTEGSNKVYISFETLKQEFKKTKQTYSLIGGIISMVLGAIGILNFMNIIVTGILTRQRELAVLSAVGMGGCQMEKMLFWESTAYVGSAAVLTATVGNFVSWIICQNETIQNQWAFVYHFTFLPVVLCMPVLMLGSAAVPFIFYKKICTKSIVERLRYI